MTVARKNKLPLVIPPAALRRAGFKVGQELEVKSASGVITIVPKSSDKNDEHTPQARRAIDRGINASLKESQQGQVKGPFETADAFLEDLHKASARLGTKKTAKTRA